MPTRNKSSVRYNFITLQYEDSYEGESLKYKDDIVKRNAALRAGKINHMRMAESRTDYDVITGLPKPKTRVPVPELGPAPVAPEKVEREKPEAYRVDMQYGVGDAANPGLEHPGSHAAIHRPQDHRRLLGSTPPARFQPRRARPLAGLSARPREILLEYRN